MELSKITEEALEKRSQRIGLRFLTPFIIPLIILISWQLICRLGLLRTFPSPLAVAKNGLALTADGTLLKNLSISLYRATAGFLIGASLGFLLGMLNGLSKPAQRLLDTSIQMLRNIPHLSLIPLLIIMIGIGESAKITLVAIGVLFPVYINTYHGIRSIDPELLEMGRSYGLNKRQLFKTIVFPGALPTILMGIRYGLGVMWTSLIVAETVAADSGIGYMATNAQDFMDMKTMILCIIIYALLGKFSDIIAKNLEALLLGWQEKGDVIYD